MYLLLACDLAQNNRCEAEQVDLHECSRSVSPDDQR